MRPGHPRPTGSPRSSRAERRRQPSTPQARLLAALAAVALLGFSAPAFAQPGDRTGSDSAADATAAEPDQPATNDAGATAEGGLTLNASAARVDLGEPVSFRGRRQPSRTDAVVKLRYRGAGDARYATVATTRTAGDGRYQLTIVPRRNGVYKAVSPRRSGATLRSGPESVDVDARVAIAAAAHQLNRRGLRVKGRVRPRGADRRVVIHNLTGKGPERLGSTRTARDGSYALRVDSPDLGRYRLRATFRGDERNSRDTQRLERRVVVYRSDHASYYGPGFYGNTTACGQTLRRGTVGVAHKRLACGTRVLFHYKGRTRRVAVIDRGPYIAGRRWDLTDAARRELGFPRGTDQVWANR